MSVIRNFLAVPNRVAMGCEYLQSAGENGVSRETFERHLSPVRGTHDEDQSGKTSLAREVLKELELLGLGVSVGVDKVRLADGLADRPCDFTAWRDLLAPRLRQWLVSEECASGRGQREVPAALAWFLCQDASRPIRRSGQHAELVAKQFRDGEVPDFNVSNDQRFQNLIYWARYIGFAETFAFQGDGTEYVIPDPTRAIREELPAVFDGSGDLPVEVFVDRLAHRLPVLENGLVRSSVELRLRTEYQRDDAHFSRSTSLALRRLEVSGEVQPLQKSDAAIWVRVDGRETAKISHLRFTGANS